MLTIDSINQRDGIEQQSELQQKGDFKDELQKLESVIINLSSIKKSEDNQNDNEKHGNRTFGFQKLRLRRTSKKKVASVNAEETKEDFMERVKKLQSICMDLKDRLKADEDKDNDVTAAWTVKSPRIESRDDNEMMSTGRENVEEERIAGDRTEVLQAIAACTKVLSNFSMDPRTSKHSMENCEIPVDEIEMTESKFLDADIDQDMQKQLTGKVEKLVDEIEITESKFHRETSEKLTDEIELTESKFLETNIDMETTNQSTENSNTSMCYDINDCKMIEAIENLVNYLVVDESSEEELEEKEATCGNEATHDYFCGMSQLWDITLDEEASPDKIGSLTEKEVSVNSVTSTVTTECRKNSTEHLKNPNESSTQDSETAHPTSPKVHTINQKEENQTDENPENEADPTSENLEMEDDVRTSLDCDFFSSLCSLTRTNGETEEVKDSEKEDEVEKPLYFDLSSLDRANTETEEVTVENSERDDNHDGTSLDCDFFNSLGSLTRTNTETESMETLKEKNREKKHEQKPKSHDFADSDEHEQKVDDFLEMTDQQCMTAITSMNYVRECVVSGFQSSDSQARDEEGKNMQVKGKGKEELAGERTINTVSSMDFIPRIEVVGFKIEKEELMEEIDQQQITSVSTMDFIPRLEVVGFKEPGNSKEPKSVKQSRREGKSVTKQRVSKGKVLSSKKSETQTQTPKMSHKEYRRMAAKNRRNKRKLKHLSKQERKSDVLRLGTIQEAPEHLEQPSNDSVYTTDKIQTKGNTMHRYTPDRRLVDQDNVITTTPDNSELENLPQKDDNMPGDIHRAPSAPQTNDGALVDDALIYNVTSSLSTWTANKSAIKEVNIRQREDCDDDIIDYENRLEKKPWFFQRRQEEEHDEIVESLSPVLSIPAQSTFGTRNEYGNIEDDEYVNHYYDFGEDDGGGNNNYDNEEYADDYGEYDHEYDIYNGEEEDDDCYVCDSY